MTTRHLLSEALGWYWVGIGSTAHLVPPRVRPDMVTACGRPAVQPGKRLRPAGDSRRCAICAERDELIGDE